VYKPDLEGKRKVKTKDLNINTGYWSQRDFAQFRPMWGR